ncbi:SAM-dependent methyltransferase [Cohnella fermenti]|uniref:Methyltransferase domain-containing protein n=1 Tax=Cohnella fermenti TaxID=2565925 RepID=A0A4V3WF60_9BACL|nr:class I SAM-dependent methyltransferase [Cohnella fermenti]THF79046.1 methyltransferase domain-containing protein [Cohnella fermenti]
MLISKLCGEKDFTTPWFVRGCIELKETFRYHRKLWEWCYILEALRERSMLYPFRRGLGFGVGREPLTSVFASRGCEIVATDMDAEKAKAQGWADTNQHALGLDDLNEKGLCNPNLMKRLVTYETVDMNAIPERYHGKFDFTWSSCSFEHIGSIEKGKRFLLEQMKCLRSGGVAVHTTEYNLSSNEDTLEAEVLVIFRKRDIEEMVAALRQEGYLVEIDYTAGTGPFESIVDVPPFHFNPHLRLQLGQYVSTSVGLIIHKP